MSTWRLRKGCACGGWIAPPLAEEGLRGASDVEQLAFATSQQRILVTTDEDFLALAPRQPHAGILYWHQESRSIGEVIRRIVRLCEQHTPEAIRNRFMFL